MIRVNSHSFSLSSTLKKVKIKNTNTHNSIWYCILLYKPLLITLWTVSIEERDRKNILESTQTRMPISYAVESNNTQLEMHNLIKKIHKFVSQTPIKWVLRKEYYDQYIFGVVFCDLKLKMRVLLLFITLSSYSIYSTHFLLDMNEFFSRVFCFFVFILRLFTAWHFMRFAWLIKQMTSVINSTELYKHKQWIKCCNNRIII